MTRSLTGKLTLAFLLVAITVGLLLAVVLRLSSANQLDRLIVEQRRSDMEGRLVAYYRDRGSWEGLREDPSQLWIAPGAWATHPPGDPKSWDFPPLAPRDRRALFGVADAQGVVVVPLPPDHPAGARVAQDELARGEPIEVDGRVVGMILTAERPPGLNPEEAAYLQRANSALLLASAGAVLVALLVGVGLARTLTRPLRALTQAAHRVAGGELEQEVHVRSGDEIGELAAAFNRMSRELARASQARRQMTADVAHELRTPLTVVTGYVEAMRDGVLAPTPERLSVIYAELERLQRLVGDLRTLAQADAGELRLNRQPVAVGELLRGTASAFEHQAAQKGVSLALDLGGELPPVFVDETRMAQALGNLLTNALRHTPEGGRVVLGAATEDGRVTLSVQDSGEGIPPEDLPFVFNRFYRADKSRAEEGGESGLGLAIVKALVEAHGGTVDARSSLGQGATVLVRLPAGKA